MTTTLPMPRKVTMEEKRKLEKMLLADVDLATEKFLATRREQRSTIEHNISNNPPLAAIKFLAKFRDTQASLSRIEGDLSALGYRPTTSYGELKLSLTYGRDSQPRELRDYDIETDSQKAKFNELKRSFTLKLFGGATEAQELFASLTAELAAITF